MIYKIRKLIQRLPSTSIKLEDKAHTHTEVIKNNAYVFDWFSICVAGWPW